VAHAYTGDVNPVAKLLGWLRPSADPEAEAESERLRTEMETIRTSQLGQGTIVPPTPDITEPDR
jgi:hypothetical protein